jgi:hypothetical protein
VLYGPPDVSQHRRMALDHRWDKSSAERPEVVASVSAVTLVAVLLAIGRITGRFNLGGGIPTDVPPAFAGVLLVALLGGLWLLVVQASLRSRIGRAITGAIAVAALLLMPAHAVSRDASGEGNGFAGCGTILDPAAIGTPTSQSPAESRAGKREWSAQCEQALSRQRRLVVLLALPGAAAAVGVALSITRQRRPRVPEAIAG